MLLLVVDYKMDFCPVYSILYTFDATDDNVGGQHQVLDCTDSSIGIVWSKLLVRAVNAFDVLVVTKAIMP
jgi:hypothetical protein